MNRKFVAVQGVANLDLGVRMLKPKFKSLTVKPALVRELGNRQTFRCPCSCIRTARSRGAEEIPPVGVELRTAVRDVARNGPERDLVHARAVGLRERELLAFRTQSKAGMPWKGQRDGVTLGQVPRDATPFLQRQRTIKHDHLEHLTAEGAVGARANLDRRPRFTTG